MEHYQLSEAFANLLAKHGFKIDALAPKNFADILIMADSFLRKCCEVKEVSDGVCKFYCGDNKEICDLLLIDRFTISNMLDLWLIIQNQLKLIPDSQQLDGSNQVKSVTTAVATIADSSFYKRTNEHSMEPDSKRLRLNHDRQASAQSLANVTNRQREAVPDQPRISNNQPQRFRIKDPLPRNNAMVFDEDGDDALSVVSFEDDQDRRNADDDESDYDDTDGLDGETYRDFDELKARLTRLVEMDRAQYEHGITCEPEEHPDESVHYLDEEDDFDDSFWTCKKCRPEPMSNHPHRASCHQCCAIRPFVPDPYQVKGDYRQQRRVSTLAIPPPAPTSHQPHMWLLDLMMGNVRIGDITGRRAAGVARQRAVVDGHRFKKELPMFVMAKRGSQDYPRLRLDRVRSDEEVELAYSVRTELCERCKMRSVGVLLMHFDRRIHARTCFECADHSWKTDRKCGKCRESFALLLHVNVFKTLPARLALPGKRQRNDR